MFRSRKCPYSPDRRDCKFLGGWALKMNKLKEMYEVLLEFPEGWGILSQFVLAESVPLLVLLLEGQLSEIGAV